ncbi:histidine-containing phosphotransfer protein 1 isoform X3 [Ziziphus jujuba]|uniref:Histidine-containing phosphotransfer protein n=1 Tax=Ziziphus jujuba TaxID=326968 RepID=A0ABM3I9T1_ZIZJJ|nr:histidine-containing phosphotransfer protein 1 isoform X3 [Ziziphus jujuba]
MLICIPGVNPQGTMQNSWQSDNHCLSNLSLKLLYLHAELFHSHHGLLEEYVQSLFDEGIVNDQFSQIQTLKSMEQPDLVVQLIDAYLVDVEMILSELTSYSDFPDVDFSKVTLLAHKVKDRSSCFVRALSWIKKEFSCTQDKLESYAQMERRIIRLESRQKGKACTPTNSA